jgi:PAS domain-containing protein
MASFSSVPVLDGVDFFQRVIDAVPQPIFVKDANSHFVALNLAMCALMGAQPAGACRDDRL